MSESAVKQKKKKRFNANSATLKWLASEGWIAELVESRIPTTWITRDLFGVIDILAIHPAKRVIAGFQATSGGGHKGQSNGLARRRKVLAGEKAKLFVQCGGTLSLVVWSELTDQHGDTTWQPTVSGITLADFA